MNEKYLFIGLFFIFFSVKAQKPILNFNQIGSNLGLSNNNVWAIQKDKNGFLWIGTEDGLNLYDGYSFKTFRSNSKDSSSISGNSIHFLCNEGRDMWVGTNEGLSSYNWTKNCFENYKPADSIWLKINKFISQKNNIRGWRNSVNTILDLKDKKIFIGTDLGALIFDTKNKRFNKLNAKNKEFDLDTLPIHCSTIDKKGMVWIATKAIGLVKYDKNKGTIEKISDFGDILSIYSDNEILWLGTYNGFIKYNVKSKTSQKYISDKTKDNSLVSSQVDAINKGVDGLMWFGTTNGLSLFDPVKDIFYNYRPAESDATMPYNYSIKTIYRDSADITWVGTRKGGIGVLDLNSTKFEHFKNSAQNSNSLSNNIISRIVEDENKMIWIATDGGGLNRFDRSTNSFTHIKSNPDSKTGLSSNSTIALYANQKGGLWIGMWEGGLNYYDLKTQQFTQYKSDKSKGGNNGDLSFAKNLYNNRIFYLEGDKFGDLWIAHWGGGLSRYDIKNKFFYKYPITNKEAFGEMYSHVGVCLIVDEKQNIWYGTQQTGLYYWERDKDKFTRFTHDDKNPNSISNNTVFCVLEDSKKRIWIGTEGGGLNLYDPKTKQFSVFRMSDGLPNDVITGILEDKTGRIWISTGNGMSCATFKEQNKKTVGVFKNFTVENGLQGTQFSRWASFKNSSGELYFGGLNGFNIIQPEKIKDNRFIPNIVFTDFQIRYKSIKPAELNSPLSKNILETKKIILNYDQDIITFEFAALNFTQTHKNQYQFFMKGFDHEWLKVGSQRKATYTNLSPGDYIFYVKGSNNDGVWNETPISIAITILPPWWRTWWFKSFSFLMIILIAFAFYKNRVNKINKQKEILEQLVKKRTTQLEISNEELKSKHIEISQQKEEIFQQIEELASQRDKLTDKNKQISLAHDHIKASIRYANTIQKAILPDENELNNKFDIFILYEPKDVVSGDFYWYSDLTNNNKKEETECKDFIFATIDCTGHGVPGAFMSMIGSSLLNRIVNELEIFDPALILNQLDQGVYKSLKQETSDNTDGMDVVICRVTYIESEKVKLIFSGARSHLFYYEKKKMEVTNLKGSHKYIGGKLNVQKKEQFTNNEIILEKGDMIYLATDGYIDQNNNDRKRFGSDRFVKLIKEIAELSTKDQLLSFKKNLENWQSLNPQRDDITVIGIRL